MNQNGPVEERSAYEGHRLLGEPEQVLALNVKDGNSLVSVKPPLLVVVWNSSLVVLLPRGGAVQDVGYSARSKELGRLGVPFSANVNAENVL